MIQLRHKVPNFINFRSFCDKSTKYREIISRETEIVSNQLVPELKLHLITKNCRLFHSPVDENFPFPTEPFFAFFWPGGISITRFIFDNQQLVRNKSILDFGSGSAAIAIASKMCGAKRAVANDIDEVAEIAAQMNAKLNHVKIETEVKNLINDPSTSNYDLIFLGDVFYDEEFAALILPWIKKLVASEKVVIIGDPGRHALKNKFELNLKLLQRYELPENVCIENHGFQFTNVWQLQ
jgi:ETFB lysine methyltransferase